ncbi:MAG: hypothetical protein M3Y91_17875 [Actinomycetota bacterium]|nr:hypothetical protein [Actinomycetota bacterium]
MEFLTNAVKEDDQAGIEAALAALADEHARYSADFAAQERAEQARKVKAATKAGRRSK